MKERKRVEVYFRTEGFLEELKVRVIILDENGYTDGEIIVGEEGLEEIKIESPGKGKDICRIAIKIEEECINFLKGINNSSKEFEEKLDAKVKINKKGKIINL